MAWTKPTTRTTGLLVTAAMWNIDIANNMTFLGASHDHSGDAGDGGTLAAQLPAGIILLFDASCPAGWTRVSTLDGRFVRGAAAYDEEGGGNYWHAHDGPAHTHDGPNHTHEMAGTHTHTVTPHDHTGPMHLHGYDWSVEHVHGGITAGAASSGNSDVDASVTAGSDDTSSGGSGWMSANGAGTTSAGTGASGSGGTAQSGNGSTIPEYIEVVFCKKN
jgi:hypothetical protein